MTAALADRPFLVAGCAGFIGARVCELLLEAGGAVMGVDTLNDAYDPRLKEWRLSRLRQAPRFSFQRLDICDRDAVLDLFAAGGGGDRRPFGGVVNLAARAGVRPSVSDPWAYLETNAGGTLNLLEGCRRHGSGKFILASSSSLYGTHNAVPYREDCDASRPVSPYAASKQAAESLAYAYHHLHGLDVSVLRYFTVYGPAGRPDMSVFRFISQIAEGTPITLFGDGEQSRDFTFVDDIARGTIAAGQPLGYEIINLGSDRPIRVNELIGLIEARLGKKAIVERHPAHPADVPATWADISKARRLLDWSPHVSLEQGLEQTIDWYMRERNWARLLALGE